MGYDSSGRMRTVTLPTGTETLGYSATTGRLTSATGPYGVNLAYAYDGRLLTGTTWTGAVAGSVTRTYDNFFRISTETIDGQAATTATLGYDNDGLVTSVATPAGSMALTYDPTAPRLQTTTLGSVTDARTYDQFGEVASYDAKFGSSDLYNASYVRDALGRIQQKTETIQGTTTVTEYGYDQVGRLISVAENGAAVRTYAYDANGNRTLFTDVEHGTTSAGTYDAQDRLLTYGTLTYTYTKDGALATKTDTSTGQTTTYAYDALGNLTHVGLPDGRAIDYVIDGMGRRVGKKINGVMVKQWLYADDLRIVAELDGSGNVVSRFVWADGTGASDSIVRSTLRRLGLALPSAVRRIGSLLDPAYMISGGAAYRFLVDQVGTPRMLVNASSGQMSQLVTEDEWGTSVADSNPGFQPIGFGGGTWDRDTGLSRFGARDYDASVGRWTRSDPVRFFGHQANLYSYLDDPINSRDPRGLDANGCNLVCGLATTVVCGGVGVGASAAAGATTLGMGAAIGLTVGADCYLATFPVCYLACRPPPTPPAPTKPPAPSPPGPQCQSSSPCDPTDASCPE